MRKRIVFRLILHYYALVAHLRIFLSIHTLFLIHLIQQCLCKLHTLAAGANESRSALTIADHQ